MPSAPSRDAVGASATTCPRERERLADNEALIRARVTQLWQTRMLRTAKLTVADEIENALSYYQPTFLREIPRLYRDIERALPGHAVAPLPAHGPLDRRRPRRQPQRHRRHAAPCAVAAGRDRAALLPDRGPRARRRAVDVGTCWHRSRADMQALAERSPDHSAHRSDEPYRRALIGMYARLAATLQAADRHRGRCATRWRRRTRTPSAQEFLADLQRRSSTRCTAHHAQALVGAAAGAADARGAGVRLSSGHAGPAPELGQARSGGGRTAGAPRASSPTTARSTRPQAARCCCGC